MLKTTELNKLAGQKIALLGLGLDNQALLLLLDKKNIPAEITICDKRTKKRLDLPILKNIKLNYQLGTNFNKELNKFDILFRSPGWPLFCPGVVEAIKDSKTKLSSPLNIFFALCPSEKIIGVTGTKGKGTTASLIYEMLKANKKSVFLGGNIGIAPLSFLEKIQPNDYVVLELSSFQLEDLEHSPHISVITNFYQEHLVPADPYNPNFHYSLDQYWKAKLNIAKKQTKSDYLVINQALKKRIDDKDLLSHITYFTKSNLPSKLMGDFNQENIDAAIKVAQILKIDPTICKEVVRKFANLEHRLEFVAQIDGVKYFNNSFSTTPESTILDLESFTEPIVLIAGGADKGADFKGMAREIKASVKFLILLPGGSTGRIKESVLKLDFANDRIKEVRNMSRAVRVAKSRVETGDVVLLSTGCASFGIFKNYKERGNLFKEYVKKIS